jgi:integrase
MSLYRKPDSQFWWYTFYFQGKRYRASTGEKTRGAAGTVEAAVLTKLNEGLAIPVRSARLPTLQAFSVRFLEWVENSRQLEPNTKRYYRYGWRLLSFSRLASMRLDHITPEVVDCTKFMRPVMDRRTRKPTEALVELSATYLNQALRTLKAMFSKAEEWKVINDRPIFSTVESPGRDRLIDPASEAKLQKAHHAPMKHAHTRRRREQAWLVFVVMQDTGMRPDEVFPMRIENIYWHESRIWIPEGKTKNARRFVGMSDRLRQMLQVWCEGRSGWVFPSKTSKSGHLTSISKGFSSRRKQAGLDPKVVLYSARHTFGTYAFAATGNVFAVSKSMGHAGIKSMVPYQHQDTSILNDVINERNRKAAQAPESIAENLGHGFGHSESSIQ